jgi:signal transduction histidine kinase
MQLLEGIYWGLAGGIITLVLVFVIKYVLKKQFESEIKKLTEQNLSLTKSNSKLEKFTHIASHNLRAPVLNLVSLTQMQKETGLPVELKEEIFDKIHLCVVQLDGTLKDLLEIVASKAEGKIKSEVLNLEEEFNQILNSIENQVQDSGLQVEVDFSDVSTIYFPKPFLNSILLNLVTNAIKYKSAERRLMIKLKSETKNGQSLLHFSDNGIGIDLEKFGDKIFGLYQRFHTHAEGKGMGLYIIKSQVEAMGGTIEVESKPNQGTHFRICFDAKTEA